MMYSASKKYNIYDSLLIFLMIFQSCGIRLFEGIGIFLSISIFLLLIGKVRVTSYTLIPILVFPLLAFLFLYVVKEININYVINVILLLINSIMFIAYINQKGEETFLVNFEFVLKLICIHAAINAVLDLVLPSSLLWHTNDTILDYTFLYIFYFTESSLPFLGMTRLSGFMWEPGTLQLFLNMYILLCICKGKRLKEYIYVFVLVFLTGSTTGYIIMLINILIYLYTNKQIKLTILALLLSLVTVPVLYSAISDKMVVGNSSSATIRYRDIYIGIRSVCEHPILGINTSDMQNSKEIEKYEVDAIYKILGGNNTWFYGQRNLAGGYTNGFFFVLMLWGIGGWLLLSSFFKCRIWKLYSHQFSYVFPIIIVLSMISEPISNTFFFYFFSLYNFYAKKVAWKKICIDKTYKTN